MKKITVLFASALVLGLSLASCNKDDDSSSSSSSVGIEGKWKYSKEGAIVSGQEVLTDYVNEAPECGNDYIEVLAGGTAKDYYFYNDGGCVSDVATGTWSKSGNTMTVTFDGVTENATILTLNSTTLKVKYTDNESGMEMLQVYTRM